MVSNVLNFQESKPAPVGQVLTISPHVQVLWIRGAHLQDGNLPTQVCLTDGAQAVCGIERRPIAALRQAGPGWLWG